MSERDIHRELLRPFPVSQISWRCGSMNKDKTSGIALAYIDARDVMRRLDDVFGPMWQCRYSHAEGKTICEIGAKIDGEWLWRAGGAGDTDIEAEKGAISDAFKRAAVLWGIGRYLYELPNEWVEIDERKRLKSTPALPKWATPEGFDGIMKRRTYVMKCRTAIAEHLAADRDLGALQEWEEAQALGEETASGVWAGLTTPERDKLRALQDERAAKLKRKETA